MTSDSQWQDPPRGFSVMPFWFLGYDFTPHLPALWYNDEPEADRYR